MAKQNILREANLTHSQMQTAILKLERRLQDLENFDLNTVSGNDDSKVVALQQVLDAMLVNIFGSDTVEYARYVNSLTSLDQTSYSMMSETPDYEIREGVRRGITSAISSLLSIKKGFEEELEDAGLTTATKTLKAYEGLELHPEIQRAAGTLYRNGHYANAIEDSVKALNGLVRLRSGVDDKDGTGLMEFVFSPKSPILQFNKLIDDSDRDEQKGFMMMFSGAVAGLRNPRAHKIIQDDPEKALEFIAFISLLAKLVDEAVKSS